MDAAMTTDRRHTVASDIELRVGAAPWLDAMDRVLLKSKGRPFSEKQRNAIFSVLLTLDPDSPFYVERNTPAAWRLTPDAGLPELPEVGPLDLSAPPRVWLQVNVDGDEDDRSEVIPREAWGELTWCSESIGGQEVQYVRADLARAYAAASGVPEGWVMVPREPTNEMFEAAASFGGGGGYSRQRGHEAIESWAHMLEAAPKPAAPSAASDVRGE